MKKYFIALSIMMLMLSACGHSNDRIDFPQAVLSTPTSIKVNNGISEIYLTPEQLEFSEVVALIERNWWKTIKDINEPLTDANLKDMDAPIKILNTFSEKELSNQDILISFYYKEPIKWKNVINSSNEGDLFKIISYVFILDTTFATVYKGNIIKNLIMDCQSYTKYRPNETTGGIFVSWRRKEELPTGA